jgi:putative hydrolase of the HAD superfamily
VTRAVLFDFGGTLDADGVPWKTRFYRLCVDEGLASGAERFDPVFYAADDALVGAISPSLSFEETVDRLAHDVARGLGGDAAAGRRIGRRFLGDSLERLRANTPLLSRLREHYQLGIVSNFYGNLVTVCHNAAIRPLFSAIVDSVRVGCVKPDPRIFQSALDELGVTPADALFVGDSLPRDMAGARAMGMPHIWLAGDAAPATSCCPGDRVLRSLTDLEGVLLGSGSRLRPAASSRPARAVGCARRAGPSPSPWCRWPVCR